MRVCLINEEGGSTYCYRYLILSFLHRGEMLKQIHKIYIYAHFMFLLYINRLVHVLCSLPSKIYVLLGILPVKHFLKRNKHCYIILVQDFARLLYRFFHNIILFLFKNSAGWGMTSPTFFIERKQPASRSRK